jgi:hydrogenase maturation protease
MSDRVCVVGVGSPDGDDRLAWAALAALREGRVWARMPPGAASLHTCDRPGVMLLQAWRHADKAILVDAVCSGAAPGTLWRLPGDAIPGSDRTLSTHGFGISLAVELATALHRLPAELVFLGMEMQADQRGDELSPVVRAALPELVRAIETELEFLLR